MSSVAARLCAAGVLALCVAACRAAPSEVHRAFEAGGLPRVEVTLTVPAGHAGEAERDVYAAFTTLRVLGTWLRPFPDATLAIAVERTPWWTTPAAMAPEYAVARAVSRRYWERVLDSRRLPAWFVAGLAEFCARRAVSKIVDERYLAVSRSRAEARYFGGFVPRDLRVPLRVEDEGDPVGDYLARPRGRDDRALEARTLLALGTLERWLGRPVFDEVVGAFARANGEPSLDDFAALAGRVSGQDLRWFADQTLESDRVIDYGLTALSTGPQSDGWYDTTVAVGRFGDGVFSGANDSPADDRFEHGRAIVVSTTFADGATVRDAWDGRASATAFRYRSRSPAVSAVVDPDRVLLLDVNRRNNGLTLDPRPARTAAARWAARWMIWFEDALLTYAAFS